MLIQFSEIEKLFPENIRRPAFRKNMLKEYFHYQMLNMIYNSPFAGNLFFLGGTCLRIVHGFQRFSEDLDFDCRHYEREDHLELCSIIVKKFKRLGIDIEIEPIREEKLVRLKAFQSTINFPQLLFKLNLTGHKEEKFKIKIEAQSHNFPYQPESIIIQKFDVFTPILKVPDDIMLSTKICAAIQRQKGRDFLDVVNLLGIIKPNFEYLKEKLGIGTPRELKEHLLEVTKSINFESKMEDCRHLVWDDSELNKIKLFRQYINQYDFGSN